MSSRNTNAEPEGPVVRIEALGSDGYVELFPTLTGVAILVSDGTAETSAVLTEESQDLVAMTLFGLGPLLPNGTSKDSD